MTCAFSQNLVVTTNSGQLQGMKSTETDIDYFRGIPYAAAPVGDLRWKAPQPAVSWTGVRDATQFGSRCMQKFLFDDMRFRSPGISEDCLFLNVWTPTLTPRIKLPVLVYFYGGGFVAGDSSEWRYDGTSLAQKGIVVVTVNYRLGIFGFFAHPELTAESPNHASGNYGLLDQVAALKWVKENIAGFGGDPSKITIGGESAGSMSVSGLMASPLSKNLIAGAIGESGAFISPTAEFTDLKTAEEEGVAFSKKIKVKDLKELRAIPAEQLLQLYGNGFKTHAVVDGYLFHEKPVNTFAKGNQAQVPLLVGWNSTESDYNGFLLGAFPNPKNYKAQVQKTFGKNADAVLKAFPGNTENQVIQSATALASDQFIVFSTWKWSELQRENNSKPVYRYLFSRERPPFIGLKTAKSTLPKPLSGAGHSWEIEYALGNLSLNKDHEWSPDDDRVSITMQNYFANFIKTGDPNGSDLEKWIPNTKGKPVKFMNINVETKLQPQTSSEKQQFETLNRIYSSKNN